MNLDFDHWLFQILGISLVLMMMYLLFKYISKLIPKEDLELIEETLDMYIEYKYWINLFGTTFDNNATYLKLGINKTGEIILQTRSFFPNNYNSFILVHNSQDLKNIFYYNVIDFEIGNEILKLKINGKLSNVISLTVTMDSADKELLYKIKSQLMNESE